MNKTLGLKKWVVIGSGPAGVTYLTQLLSRKIQPSDLMWIDESFNGGAFSKYKDVPGNTKVKTFIHWATSNSILKSLSQESPDPLNELKSLDPEKSCSLGIVQKLISNYTNQLRKIVPSKQAKVTKLEFDNLNHTWKTVTSSKSDDISQQSGHPLDQSLSFDKSESFLSECVCIATGARPLPHTNLHLGFPEKKVLSVADSLNLDYLRSNIKSGDVIGIIGGSHTAFLIMYLINSLNIPDVKIVNFHRGAVRHAVFKDGFILYDNTGLKGEISEWVASILAKKHKPNFELTRISVNASEDQLSEKIRECNKFVYANGFGSCSIPEIIYKLPEAVGYECNTDINPNISAFIQYSNLNGAIMTPSNTNGEQVIEGLYGFGFAFPEKVITRIGEKECNVGMAKFAVCAEKWLGKIKLEK